jgi:hypothetical protein
VTRESTNGRVRHSLAEWRTICERFARSGLGAEEFCLREKLTVSSFKKWYRRYLGEEQQGTATAEAIRKQYNSYNVTHPTYKALAEMRSFPIR